MDSRAVDKLLHIRQLASPNRAIPSIHHDVQVSQIKPKGSPANPPRAVSVSERSNAGSSSKRKRGDNEIIDDKTWTSGNFEVITSDRVRFRVQDYLLFASR